MTPPLLLCDPTSRFDPVALAGCWETSPVRCLERIHRAPPRWLALRFGPERLGDAPLLDLCAAASACTVVALLASPHRRLLELLDAAGARVAHVIGSTRLEASLLDLPATLGPADELSQHLASTCPNLRYQPMQDGHELTVCGAYRDRLVLGGRRLHETCWTAAHQACEFRLHPRRKP